MQNETKGYLIEKTGLYFYLMPEIYLTKTGQKFRIDLKMNERGE